MDTGTFAELKETLNIAYQLCDNIEQSGCWPMSGQLKMSDLLKYELVAFCRQLAAADKDFSLDERGFITSLFGLQGALLLKELLEHPDEDSCYTKILLNGEIVNGNTVSPYNKEK